MTPISKNSKKLILRLLEEEKEWIKGNEVEVPVIHGISAKTYKNRIEKAIKEVNIEFSIHR